MSIPSAAEVVAAEGVRDVFDLPCHCVRGEWDGKPSRIAWGIYCARYVVGADLMAEEDLHAGAPWSDPGDCRCE